MANTHMPQTGNNKPETIFFNPQTLNHTSVPVMAESEIKMIQKRTRRQIRRWVK